jgi:hypothetical protein
MGLQYTFASSYGSGDKHCDGNQRCDRRASNCNQSGGQSGDNFSWELCTGGNKPFDQGGWLYRREITLGQHGSSGSKHRCFSVCSPYLGYEQGAKQSPCTDSKQRKFLGYKWKGGGGWHGNNEDVRVSKFNDSNTALQCLFDVNASKLKTWSNKSYITKAGAKDDNGRFMNQYDQMLWGIRIKDGLKQQTGFCHAGNADTVVHQNGKTCQELAADNFSSLPTSDSRWGIWDTLTNASCSKPENLTKIIKPNSNVTCSDRDTSKTLAKQWCSIGENIVSDSQSFCTKAELGTALYEELAKNYCEANPDKDFCGCYNVMQPGLCEQVPNLPGCKTVKPVWDKITSSLDEGDIAQFEGMQPCYGSVCSGNVYQPTSWDASCNRDISICKADFDIGGDLVGSNINLKQDCGNNNEGGGGDGDGGGGDDDDDEEKSLTEKLFKFEEDKDKKLTEKRSTKIFGTVSSVSSCFMCMTALVLFT